MAGDTNTTTLIGRLTKDAELKQSEYSVSFFTIAVNRKKKQTDGNYEEEASFFDVNIFGKYAEIIIDRLKKGVQVCVTGELKQERWKDKGTGDNRSRIVVLANSVQILGTRNHE